MADEGLSTIFTTDPIVVEAVESGHIFMKICFTIISVLGVTGNGLVLVVFYNDPELRFITNILIGHQSLVDLISSFLLFLTFVLPGVSLETICVGHPVLASIICKIWVSEFLYWAAVKVSTLNLVFLTMTRYFAIVRPMYCRMRASKRGIINTCYVMWIVGTLTVIYFPVLHNVSDDGECTTNLERGSVWRYLIAFIALFSILIMPLMVMLYVYISIVWKLRPAKTLALKRQRKMAVCSMTRSNGSYTLKIHFAPTARYAKERNRRNVLTTLFIVCLTYTICWTPDIILYFHHNVVTRHDWKEPFHQFAILLAASNVCVNPLIYSFKYKNFQKGLKRLSLKCAKCSSRSCASTIAATKRISESSAASSRCSSNS